MKITKKRTKRKSQKMLTAKQQGFVDLVIEGNKPIYECYMTYYKSYNQKTASENASKLLRLPHIESYIKRHKRKVARRLELKEADVLEGLLRIANFDHRKLEDDNGKFIQSIKHLDDETALAISKIEYQTIYVKKGKIRVPKQIIKKIEVDSKSAAWEKIGNYLGMFNGDGNKEGPQEFINSVRDFASQVSEGVPGGEI